MTYRLLPDGSVLDAEGNQHPPDPRNSGYAAFLAWRAAGGVPEVVTPPVPRRLVEKGVIVERLIAARKLEAALAALAMLPIEDQQRWANKVAVYADDRRARGLIEAIGLNPDEVLA